jgi:hypothetical protein
MINSTPLYPIGIMGAVLLLIAGLGWKTSGWRWATALGIVAAVQLPGYVIISRMMYATGDLLPQQLLFAALATALTTKLVVFSPTFVARITDPTFEPSLDRYTIVGGLAASWLIQLSLGVLYLFPDTMLRAVMMWALPSSTLHVYIWPLLVGAVLGQVTIAGQIYATSTSPSPTPSSTTESETSPVAVTDGGED